MSGARAAAILRQQMLLWVAAVAVTLGLLAMHQLSVNHTAARPTTPQVSTVDFTAGVLEKEHHTGPVGVHAHPVTPASDQQPAPSDDACPGCADHHLMALTCLATWTLLALGWALRLPTAWRGVLLPRRLLQQLSPPRQWRRPPVSLLELSVSRT